jgi:hypothetical protein
VRRTFGDEHGAGGFLYHPAAHAAERKTTEYTKASAADDDDMCSSAPLLSKNGVYRWLAGQHNTGF